MAAGMVAAGAGGAAVAAVIGVAVVLSPLPQAGAATCGAGPAGASAVAGSVAGLPSRVGPYSGDQLVNAALIVRAGQAAGVPARGLVVGVMTAMGESSLRVLDFGDERGGVRNADGSLTTSKGLFQQQGNGAWGTLADRMDPTRSSTNFFVALTGVSGWQALAPTIAAHRVQRNQDEQYYAPFWADAVKVTAAVTGDGDLAASVPSSGAEAVCGAGQPGETVAGSGEGVDAVNAALTQLGVPYSWGGGTPRGPSNGFAQGAGITGFDCSSLMQFAWAKAGVQLPRVSQAQHAALAAVPLAQVQAGDLLFFHGDSHVSIADGKGGFVHAPRTGKTVEVVTDWQSISYWTNGFEGAARPGGAQQEG